MTLPYFFFALAFKVSIHLSNKYLLCTCSAPGTGSGGVFAGEGKGENNPCPQTLYPSGVIDMS